jgi:phage gpG-like protein
MKPEAKFDLSKLNSFVKALTKKQYVKVGILGSKSSRNGAGPTNAEIGAIHELGSFEHNIPIRSFLRMPLFHQSSQIIEDVAKNQKMEDLVKEDGITKILERLGAACIRQINEAFVSRGFGTWPALKPVTIKRKIGYNPDPLINTRQLQRSVTAEVKEVK